MRITFERIWAYLASQLDVVQFFHLENERNIDIEFVAHSQHSFSFNSCSLILPHNSRSGFRVFWLNCFPHHKLANISSGNFATLQVLVGQGLLQVPTCRIVGKDLRTDNDIVQVALTNRTFGTISNPLEPCGASLRRKER